MISVTRGITSVRPAHCHLGPAHCRAPPASGTPLLCGPPVRGSPPPNPSVPSPALPMLLVNMILATCHVDRAHVDRQPLAHCSDPPFGTGLPLPRRPAFHCRPFAVNWRCPPVCHILRASSPRQNGPDEAPSSQRTSLASRTTSTVAPSASTGTLPYGRNANGQSHPSRHAFSHWPPTQRPRVCP
jgi:hypothetical protein